MAGPLRGKVVELHTSTVYQLKARRFLEVLERMLRGTSGRLLSVEWEEVGVDIADDGTPSLGIPLSSEQTIVVSPEPNAVKLRCGVSIIGVNGCRTIACRMKRQEVFDTIIKLI